LTYGLTAKEQSRNRVMAATERSRRVTRNVALIDFDRKRWTLKSILGYQMQMTVNLTVNLVGAEKSSIHDNCLQVPFTIEWE
jgi:hypothetical protein